MAGVVRARAPLRLGLAGGGTDVSPYCDRYGGNVLNVTISLFAYATIAPARGPTRLRALDLDRELAFDGEAPAEAGPLLLHAGVYRRMVREFNGGAPLAIEVVTHCEAPPGSGLGSSSAVVVAMVEAYRDYLRLPLGKYDVARLAYEIERVDLKLNGGKQDQYAATFGGFNFMEFYEHGRVIVNPLRIPEATVAELEASLVLYATGVSRDSAVIIDEQAARIEGADAGSLEATHRLKADAVEMKEHLLRGNIPAVAAVLERSWAAKKRLAHKISNDGIEHIRETGLGAGAYAGKVSGAGGGGVIMFLVDPARRPAVLKALAGMPGGVLACHLTERGSMAWRLPA